MIFSIFYFLVSLFSLLFSIYEYFTCEDVNHMLNIWKIVMIFSAFQFIICIWNIFAYISLTY